MKDARLSNHRRRLVGVAVLAAVAAGTVVWLPGGSAAPSTITRQMEAVRQLEAEISGLDARYGQASAAYTTAKDTLADINERIGKNTAALKKARKDFVTAQQTLGNRMSMVYRQPTPTQVEILLRAGSLSAAASGVDHLNRIQRRDGKLVVAVRAHKARIAAARVQLVKDRTAAKAQEAETRARLAEIADIRASRRTVLFSARRQLSIMIAAEAQRQANAQRLAALRNAQRRVVQRIGQDGQPQPTPVSTPTPTPAPSGGNVSDKLQAIAQCESGGNPTAVSPSGLYRGKYQFDPSTWASLGGSGSDPAAASESEQDRVAALLYSQRGAAPWPVCGR